MIAGPPAPRGVVSAGSTAARTLPPSLRLTHQLVEALAQLRLAQPDSRPASDHDQIQALTDLTATMTKPFPHPPLEAISIHRLPGFAAGGDPKPAFASGARGALSAVLAVLAVIAGEDQNHVRMGETPSLPHHATKISRVQQAIGTPEALRLHARAGGATCRPARGVLGRSHDPALGAPPALLRRDGRCQSMAALGPTSLQHQSARRRLHAGAKTVFTKPLDPARLISPLHCCGSSAIQRLAEPNASVGVVPGGISSGRSRLRSRPGRRSPGQCSPRSAVAYPAPQVPVNARVAATVNATVHATNPASHAPRSLRPVLLSAWARFSVDEDVKPRRRVGSRCPRARPVRTRQPEKPFECRLLMPFCLHFCLSLLLLSRFNIQTIGKNG